MKENHSFSPQELFAKIQEVEQLATRILTLEHNEEQKAGIYRHAIVKDQIQDLLLLAEEVLSEEELHQLHARVNTTQHPNRWDFYRNTHGIRAIKRATGKNLWDHPRIDLSLNDLLDPPPDG